FARDGSRRINMKTILFAVPEAGSGICKKATFIAVLAVAASALRADIAMAQQAVKPKILFSQTPHDPSPTITNPRLRPHTPQQLPVYVRNDADKPVAAFVELRAGGAIVPGSRAPVNLPVGLTSISLPKPPAPPPGGKPAAPTALPAPLQVRLLGAKNEVLDE